MRFVGSGSRLSLASALRLCNRLTRSVGDMKIPVRVCSHASVIRGGGVRDMYMPVRVCSHAQLSSPMHDPALKPGFRFRLGLGLGLGLGSGSGFGLGPGFGLGLDRDRDNHCAVELGLR